MVKSPAEKIKSRSFSDAKNLGLFNKERINSQEQSLRQPEREIEKGRRRGRKFNVAARKWEVNKRESGDQGKIVPYEESCRYRRDTYV